MCGLADVEPDEQRARRPHDATEFCEHAGHDSVGHVDDRPKCEHACEQSVGEGEVGHRADLETDVGMVAPCNRHHLRRDVDPEGVDIERTQWRVT